MSTLSLIGTVLAGLATLILVLLAIGVPFGLESDYYKYSPAGLFRRSVGYGILTAMLIVAIIPFTWLGLGRWPLTLYILCIVLSTIAWGSYSSETCLFAVVYPILSLLSLATKMGLRAHSIDEIYTLPLVFGGIAVVSVPIIARIGQKRVEDWIPVFGAWIGTEGKAAPAGFASVLVFFGLLVAWLPSYLLPQDVPVWPVVVLPLLFGIPILLHSAFLIISSDSTSQQPISRSQDPRPVPESGTCLSCGKAGLSMPGVGIVAMGQAFQEALLNRAYVCASCRSVYCPACVHQRLGFRCLSCHSSLNEA